MNEFSAHHLRLLLKEPTNASEQMGVRDGITSSELADDIALSVRLVGDSSITAPRAELLEDSGTLKIFYNPSQVLASTSSTSPLASALCTELQKIFSEEQAGLSYILSSALFSSPETRQSSGGSLIRIPARMAKPLKYGPTYHITISLFSPVGQPSLWAIEAATNEYLTPLLDAMSFLSNFTVDTQVQLYATLSPSVKSPQYDETEKSWTLREEDLSGFINAAEWPLSPSIGAGPTLNFVLYVPSKETSPLLVKGSHASSWLIPQWGGVYIHNDASDAQNLSKEAIQPAMLAFSHQLLSFMGVPQQPSSLPLQLQSSTRLRAASLLLSASSTMGSLARLTVALPSIAIPETVSDAVSTTLNHLHRSCDALRDGRFQDALNNAKVAEAEAERGFFEKSMVGQVYFPDEHKVAVYLPLLGPIGVPLVMSALKEVRRVILLYRFKRPKR